MQSLYIDVHKKEGTWTMHMYYTAVPSPLQTGHMTYMYTVNNELILNISFCTNDPLLKEQ